MKALAFVLALASATPALAFDGVYEGKGSERGGYSWQLWAKVDATSGGRRRVELQSTNANCASQVVLVGRIRNNVLQAGGKSCPLRITFNGRSMSVKELGACAMHGATCEFQGTLTLW